MHALTSTQACKLAEAIALEQSGVGAGAAVIEMRRKAWNSYDLAAVVQSVDGDRKEVVVTNSLLRQRISSGQTP